MKAIRDFLSALGVTVRPGSAYMFCPKCGAEKLTASDKKNVATCWACNAHFVPGKEREEEFLTCNHKVMNSIASRCQKELAMLVARAWGVAGAGRPSVGKPSLLSQTCRASGSQSGNGAATTELARRSCITT